MGKGWRKRKKSRPFPPPPPQPYASASASAAAASSSLITPHRYRFPGTNPRIEAVAGPSGGSDSVLQSPTLNSPLLRGGGGGPDWRDSLVDLACGSLCVTPHTSTGPNSPRDARFPMLTPTSAGGPCDMAVVEDGHMTRGCDGEDERKMSRKARKGSWLRKIVAGFRRGGTWEPFRLLKADLRNLRGRYVSDWTVFNQLVLASAVYVFFTNILPGITFASDLYVLTGKSWGPIEVVLSTGICGLIFSIFSAQPLTILGVTGPFSVLAENIYSLCVDSFKIDFLPFMAWSLIHSAWMHYLLAIFNAHDWTMQYVTNFSADIFSLLNSVIYFHKAGLELQRNHDNVSFAGFLYSVIGAVGTCLLAIFLSTALEWKPLFGRIICMGLAEYAAAISIIFFIGVPHIGELATLDQERLTVQSDFRPSDPNRSAFFVPFWRLPVAYVFGALVPGAIITVLFYFDHEISSIICTLKRYGVRKPGGFAWDIVLLGTTTAMCGILGIPPANGLLPQAPLHSESLRHWVEEDVTDTPSFTPQTPSARCASTSAYDTDDTAPAQPPVPITSASTAPSSPTNSTQQKHLVPRVHEQRYSHFLQSALILAFASPPLQRLLGLTPTSVLAGLFLYMGYQSLSTNPILTRLGHLLTPPSELPPLPQHRGGGKHGERRVRWRGVHAYTLTQVVLTGVVFGVTLTPAAPAFPVVIIALVPVRLWVMGRVWAPETLAFVDAWACRDWRPEDGVVRVCDGEREEDGQEREATEMREVREGVVGARDSEVDGRIGNQASGQARERGAERDVENDSG